MSLDFGWGGDESRPGWGRVRYNCTDARNAAIAHLDHDYMGIEISGCPLCPNSGLEGWEISVVVDPPLTREFIGVVLARHYEPCDDHAASDPSIEFEGRRYVWRNDRWISRGPGIEKLFPIPTFRSQTVEPESSPVGRHPPTKVPDGYKISLRFTMRV